MSENKSNTTGGMIIVVLIVIAIIYYFLKFLGEFLGYLLILAGIGYLIYSFISKRKSGNIVNLTDAKLVPYTAKLLGINLALLFVPGFVLLGLGSWLNVSYCDCQEIVTNGETKMALGYQNYDSLMPGNEVSAADYKECIELYQSDLKSGTGLDRGIWGTPIGYFDYMCENQISLGNSVAVLYENMKYKFGWGREEQLAELEKEEKELFGDKLAPKAPETKADSIPEVTEPDAEGEEEINVPELFEINDPDGYSNLRVSPGGKIIRKVMKGEKFEVIEKGESNSKVKLSDGTMGYIHNSRIISSQ
jgi:hypothetical protein